MDEGRVPKFALIIITVLIFIGAIAGFLLLKQKKDGFTACTLEAKICPDGSAVGRTGPNCEFAFCPSEALCEGGLCLGDVDISGWQTYRNEEYGFEGNDCFVSNMIDASDWLTYRSEEFGFELKYKDYIVGVGESENGDSVFDFLTFGLTRGAGPGFSIVVSDVARNTYIEQLAQEQGSQIIFNKCRIAGRTTDYYENIQEVFRAAPYFSSSKVEEYDAYVTLYGDKYFIFKRFGKSAFSEKSLSTFKFIDNNEN